MRFVVVWGPVSSHIRRIIYMGLCLMLQMDANRDGLVDFDEFVAATLHVHQLKETDAKKWQRRLQAAFDKFDFDGDGYITAIELKIV
jgi:calcium-dependent protein kinase